MRIILITLLIFFSSLAPAQTQQFTLDNGLKILVREDHRAPIAVSMIWYNVGSADEPGGITGISHALEHLMFKGTAKYPLGIFSKTFAALGGEENAMTSTDYTAFYEKIAATHLATSFELEADRMKNLLLDGNEFKSEMRVIQEERRLRTDNNPKALTFERFLATAHLSSPYHHPVIGWMHDLKHMQVSDARAWYQRFYAPNNATLVVVGDVQGSDVYKLAKRYFGAIAPHPQTTRKQQIEPKALGKKTTVVHAPGQLPALILGYTVPSFNTAQKIEPETPYALDLIAGILDAGSGARFSKNLVRGRQIASHLDTYYNGYSRYQTQFIILGMPNNTHTTAELEAGIMLEIEQLKTNLVDLQELQRIKTQIIAQKTFERDSIFQQAKTLGLLETIGLGWQADDQYIEQINRITPAQIQKTAQRYFTENNMTTAQLIPDAHSPR